MKYLKFLLLICVLGVILFSPGYTSQMAEKEVPPLEEPKKTPVLHLPLKEIFPGDFFIIQLENLGENDRVLVKSELFKEEPLFYPYQTGVLSLIGVNYRTNPAQYPLFIEVTRNNETVFQAQEELLINPKKFGTQYLQVTITQAAKRSESLWEKDSVLITKAKSFSQPHPLWEGVFLKPVEGRISTEFGLIRYINKVESGRHSGIDIAALEGTPVKAANNGIVNLAKPLNVTGNTVIIDHGLNLFSSYAHLQKYLVEEGQEVKKGDVIGLIGSTGFSTGPHLHWTVSLGSTFFNPWLLLEDHPLFLLK